MWWTRVLTALLALLTSATLAQEERTENASLRNSEMMVAGLWPVIPVLQKLASTTFGITECTNHTWSLLQALNNATFWAVQMVDASGHVPSGVMSGNTFSLGDFDECVSALGPAGEQGQYCLATLQANSPRHAHRPVHHALLIPPALSSAWQHVQSGGERWRAPRDLVRLALCIPASCPAALVQRAAQEAFMPSALQLGSGVSVHVPANTCSVQDHAPLATADIVFCVTAALIVLLAVVSTLYDLVSTPHSDSHHSDNKGSFARRLFLCFAARKHFLGLSRVEEGENDLNFLFGLRLISILLVIFAHKIGFTAAGPVKNPNYMEQTFSQLQYMPMLHADLVVDTFFFLAGFLLTTSLLRALCRPEARAAAAVWPLYVFRYMRLTPAYLLTVFFYATLLPRLGSGPLWMSAVSPERRYCQDNWWTNALYINNYVNVETMCIEQSWYMPCDMHLFLVCAPLVVLIHRRPRWGLALLVTLTVASLLAPFLTIYLLDTDAMLLFFLDFLKGSRVHPYFGALYVKSHVRASPYLVGVIMGWTFLKIGDKRLSMVQWVPLLVSGLGLGLATSLSGAFFYHTEGAVATSLLARAAYGALHRAVWAFALGLFVLAIAAGRIGFLKKLLSWRPLVPLSKLSYGAYLVHAVVIWYSAGTAREPAYSNSFILVLKTWGDTVATFILALFLYLMVEAPIRDITKMVLALGVKKTEKERHMKAPKKTIVYSL